MTECTIVITVEADGEVIPASEMPGTAEHTEGEEPTDG